MKKELQAIRDKWVRESGKSFTSPGHAIIEFLKDLGELQLHCAETVPPKVEEWHYSHVLLSDRDYKILKNDCAKRIPDIPADSVMASMIGTLVAHHADAIREEAKGEEKS